MKARQMSLRRAVWSGPAAGVLVALAGAALVAIGLLLVGVREAGGMPGAVLPVAAGALAS
jgi:hypothetical protein